MLDLSCEQGTLVWKVPRGALLLRFPSTEVESPGDSPSPDDLTTTLPKKQLCISFPGLETESKVSVTRMGRHRRYHFW